MPLELIKGLPEGANAAQNELFNQVLSKNNPPEEEYQNNIRQKLAEVSNKAGASSEQQTNTAENKDSTDNSALQNQVDETTKKVTEVTNEVANQTNQLKQNQTENDQLTEKANHEKSVIDQINNDLNQNNSATENQNLSGNADDIENS